MTLMMQYPSCMVWQALERESGASQVRARARARASRARGYTQPLGGGMPEELTILIVRRC